MHRRSIERTRRVAAALALALALVPVSRRPAHAFDTRWHNAATAAACKEAGFSQDAVNVVQFGNFAPDLFGPMWDTILEPGLRSRWARPFIRWASDDSVRGLAMRKSAVVLHFDNLDGALDEQANLKLDALWMRLLANTRAALAEYEQVAMDPATKKVVILMTLGVSLHMVQDFYSHTDWTHQSFAFAGLQPDELTPTPWNGDRDPTWFEVKAVCPNPNDWPAVTAGLYPPPRSDPPNSHNNVAHDNSQLVMGYKAVTGAGGSARLKLHDAGPYPESKFGPLEHIRFAVRTSSAAGVEWIQLVMQDPGAAAAIEFAHDLDLRKENRKLLWHLDGALWAVNMIACTALHFDGKSPPPAQVQFCRGLKKAQIAIGVNDSTGSAAIGYIKMAYSVFGNELFAKYQVGMVDRLAAGMNQGGRYPPFRIEQTQLEPAGCRRRPAGPELE